MNYERKIIYIACSLDGFIAAPDDNLDLRKLAIELKSKKTGKNIFCEGGALVVDQPDF